jgi:hypothetical protein
MRDAESCRSGFTPRLFEIEHPIGLSIGRALNEGDINDLQPNVTVRDMKTGWVWYDLNPVPIHAQRIGMSLSFFDCVLRDIMLWHDDDSLYGAGWHQWSEEKEKLRVKNTRKWLRDLGYPTGVYSWGEVWAQYDAKDGFGRGGITYTR